MQLEKPYSRIAPPCRNFISALLIALVLTSAFLVASPHCHERLHHDAAQSSHQCVITGFQQQGFETNDPSVVIIAISSALEVSVDASESTSPSQFTYRFSSSRAPPLSLFLVVG